MLNVGFLPSVFFLLNSLVRKSPPMASSDTFMSSEENLASLLEQLGTTNCKLCKRHCLWQTEVCHLSLTQQGRVKPEDGNFQADRKKSFESLLLETDVPSYLCEPEYSEDDVKYGEYQQCQLFPVEIAESGWVWSWKAASEVHSGSCRFPSPLKDPFCLFQL